MPVTDDQWAPSIMLLPGNLAEYGYWASVVYLDGGYDGVPQAEMAGH